MAQNNINQNGSFHTPLSPMRFQSSMGKEVKRKYKDGKNIVRLSLAKVAKVNYKYNTVDVITIQDKNDTTKNANDNGRFSARLPVQFGGTTPDGKPFGTNTLVTVGALVLVGFLEGHKDNPIVLNIYGEADNQSMLTRTTFTGADESDEELQAELWQLFTLYPSMTYKNIDGHGNQEVTFPGKTFFYASADDDRVNDAFFDYDHLPSSSYANGDLIEPTVPDAPNMLYVHQSVVGDHRVTFFIKSDGTVRMGSRHNDGKGITFWQLNTDGSFKIQQSNDTVDPEDTSNNFSAISLEENGNVVLQSQSHSLEVTSGGILIDGQTWEDATGSSLSSSLDTMNTNIVNLQGDVDGLKEVTTTDSIVQTVTTSTDWKGLNATISTKAQTFTGQPHPPYNIGDLWNNSGTIYVCVSPEGIGAPFSAADWQVAADVTSQNTAADTTNVNGTAASTVTGSISSAQSTANQAQTTAQAKTEMFLSQPTPPYNLGDIWNNNGTIYVSNITRPDGATFLLADWVKGADVTANNTANDTANVNGQSASTVTGNISSAQSAASVAQTTADGKTRAFTNNPLPPYSIGDLWNQNGKVYSCITPRAAGATFNAADWVMVADITANNTSADTTHVNGQVASTLTGTVASNTSAASTAQSTASAAQTSANNASTLATSKAKAFITQPTTPYSVGDVWDSGSTVYICQTARATGSFVAADWRLAGDVTANNTAADTTNVNGTASSTVISNISSAQSTASSANTLATSKAKGFISQPVPPYSIGDVWDNNGQVYLCKVNKASGTFAQSDWQLAGDVTSSNTAADTTNVNGQASSTLTGTVASNTSAASTAQTTANSKAKTFTTTPTVPYNLGDIWNNGATVYVCTTAKTSSGSYALADWTKVGDVTANNTSADTTNVNGTASSTVISNISSAQSTANSANSLAQSKAKGFIAQPVTPYSAGDVWDNNGTVYVCTTTRATGSFTQADWRLVGDVTANNTSADTTNVNGTASSTVIGNISSAQSTASSASSAASAAQTAADNASSLAQSKAKGFIAQPVPPYSVGDVWDNNGSVYICNTAKASGSIFSAADWTLSGDVTANNTSSDTAHVNGTTSSTVIGNISSASSAASAAQSTANSKAKGFLTQPTTPYNAGDIWNNSGTVYICTTARATGSFTQADWTLSGDVTASNTAADTAKVNGQSASTLTGTVASNTSAASSAQSTANSANSAASAAQTTANSKAKGFITQPVPPYSTGDVWNNTGTIYVCTTTKASGVFSQSDWTLAGDITSSNTSADTAKVNGTQSSTVISNISSASSAASAAQSTANSANSAASAAQTTANAKAQGFVAQPVPPYNNGDIWNSNGTVYICTTSKASGALFAQVDWTLAGDVTANNTSSDTAKVNGTQSSTVISNISSASSAASAAQSTANSANSAASAAQTTANSKAQGFTAQPVPPYNTGDVWNNNGTVYICTTAKASGASFLQADWTLAGDVTSNNTAADTAKVNGTQASTVISNISSASSAASNAQTTANSKAKTFTSAPTVPYSLGDIYKNGSTIYVCTTARATGSYTASDFVLVGDVTANNTSADTANVNGTVASTVISNISTAQSTANSANTAAGNAQTTANAKAQGFVAQPVPPYNKGDVWNNSGTVYICTTAKAAGTTYALADWTKVGDVTANNTAADTTNVNGTQASTVISNISTAQSTANSANTAASNAQSTANTAQTTANAKAQGFVTQPAPPYNKGDVWNNNGTVYICTTAKASGGIYALADWTLVGDVTASNTSADTAKVNGTVASTVISNISTAQSTASSASSAASSAQTSANNAQTTANSKAQTFTTTPVPPYNVGDIYKNGGAVYVCTIAKASGATYAAGDWVLSGDVTANNTSADTANVNGTVSSTVISNISSASSAASAAQTTANSKAKTFTATPTVPYSIGDIYKNGSTVYICTTARPTGAYTASDWILAGDVTANNTSADTAKVNGTTASTVISNITTAQSTASSASSAASAAQTSANTAQSTANSKAQGFVSQPVPPYNTGDVWNNSGTVYVCTTAKASGTTYALADWTLVGDVTSNNTAKDTAAVNGTVASTVISNISTAQSTASSASSAASAAQTSANTAQSTANSKAQGFTSQPAPPYNTGDVWNNGGTVYICTTAKASGTAFAQTDWTLAGDVTANNTSSDTAKVNGTTASTVISNISTAQSTANTAQTTANSKAKTFTATPTVPYSVGDIYKNGSTVYVCTTAKASGGTYSASDFTLVGDVTANNTSADTAKVNGTVAATVISNISTAQSTANTAQTTANSKAKAFITQPAPPYSQGDVWNNGGTVYICNTAKANGTSFAQADWTLAGDVTANNTANDVANVNGTVSSTVISNITTAQSTASSASSAASAAQTSANTAQSTANSKAQTFTSTPVPPYSVGDIYKNGSTVYVCTTAKASGGTYAASDFALVGDVTANNTSADTANVNGTVASTVISNITTAQSTASSASSAASAAQTSANTAQTTANSKAKTFTATPTVPYSLGDLYKNGSTVYICTTAKATGGTYAASDFTLVGDVTANNTSADTAKVNGTTASTVISNISTAQSTANTAQTTANSKAQGFTAQPTTPYNKGDVWNNGGTVYICTTAKASGTAYALSDWTLAGDVTASNTAADTAKVNGTTASTVISNISTAQSTANSANTAASTAQTTANSKAQTFTSTPVPPYSVGDLYKSGATVYVCTTAKASGTLYSAADFTLVGDVTSQNTAADTANVNGTVASTVISNISSAQSTASSASSAASAAQTSANTAQTTANSKSATFTATPVPPYSVGDIYKNGATVYVCTTAKASGGLYSAADFTLVGDVTANNTAADTTNVNGTASSTVIGNISSASTAASNAQTTANSKAKAFTAQPTTPYSVGDIYRNGSTIYVCTAARASGAYTATDWTLVGDVTANNTSSDTAKVNGTTASTVISNITTAQSTASSASSAASAAQTSANTAQTTANSKAQTFTTTPAPPYSVGDIYKNGSTVYVCTTAKASGGTYAASDFTLVGDVTANNTAADTANVNGTSASTVIGNISSAQSTASSASSAASAAQTSANTAQSTANSKSQTFTATPVPPYSIGDLYKNGQSVYVCTTAKASGGTYAAGDFVLAGDVTSQNTAADTTNVNGTASSTVIGNISSASSAASAAQTTANSKAKTFTATPTVPYSLGDLYKNGSTVYICTTARASGSYTASDFVLVGDVTSSNTSADTAKVNGTVAATVISNITTAQSTASSASSAASSAQTSANTAQSTANSKAQTFTAQPVPPYNLGDLYKNGGAVYVCTTAKASGTTYASGDWALAGDITANNTAADTTNVNGTASSTVIGNISSASTAASNAQTTANSKAKTYTSQPTPPYNLGDIYQSTNAVYICTLTRATGAYTASDWYKAGDVTSANTAADTTNVNGQSASTLTGTVASNTSAASTAQTTANSKSKTFTATPVPPYSLGDIWQSTNVIYICTTAKASGTTFAQGDWYKAGDVTSANTSADTSAVNGTASSTVIGNISSASSAASAAQTTANSKAKTYTVQPAPPYSTGDIWQSTNAVYICTAGRASGSYTALDWYKAGDVTSANTSADTTNVNGTASSTVIGNISSASSAASAAQTTANSKAKTYTVQPAPPYSTGDIWQSTNAVYICTAGRASGAYTATDWYKAGDVTSANTAADTTNVNGTASSTVIGNISSASSAASAAQTTANSKAKTYTSQPAPPYSTGDIWQSTNAVYICTLGRASGAYTASDWYKAGDVTSANTAADTTNVNGTASSTVIGNISSASSAASAAQTTANSKAKTFTSQPVPPYSTGDIWQTTNAIYVCTAGRASGSYTASDWYKAGDITSANTANDTANVNGTAASTVISNISSASSAASAAQGTANTAVSMLQDPGFQQGLLFLSKDDANTNAGTSINDANITVVSGVGSVGGNVIQVKNSYWLYSKYAYPIDTSHTYKVRFRVKQTIDPTTAGLSKVYAGVATYDATGALQTTSPGTHRWCAASSVTIAVADGWKYYEGTITGEGNLTANQFRPGSAYARPVFLVNYNGGDGTAQVDLLDFIDITQQVNAQGYSDTGIGNLVVGARNYHRNTYNMQDLTNWSLNIGSACVGTMEVANDPDGQYHNVVHVNLATNAASGNNWMVIQNAGLTLPGGLFTVGNQYTVSFYLRTDIPLGVHYSNADGTNAVCANSPTIPASATWTRIVYTFTATATGVSPEFYLSKADNTSIGDIYVTQLQLEDGSKATGYHMAPEDQNDMFQNLINLDFPQMQQAIVTTLTSSDTYIADMSGKADSGDLDGLATSQDVADAQKAAQDYADTQIGKIDLSPFVTSNTLTNTTTQMNLNFTSSGGINILQNSVGYSGLDFWNVTGGTPGVSYDPNFQQFGPSSGFVLNGATMNQTVIVQPGQTYTLSAVINKGSAGTGYMKVTEAGLVNPPTVSLTAGAANAYQRLSVNITPVTSSITVELNGDATSGGVEFTCVMLNIGPNVLHWQQHPGEVYNSNINFDINGIRVSQNDDDGNVTRYTVMTPDKFAGYTDQDGNGVIDTSTGSNDEVFRMDQDTFVMKNATIGQIKIVQVTGTHTGIAFIPNA